MNRMIIYFGTDSGIILCVHPANERQCYNVISSLIFWVHSQIDPCWCTTNSHTGWTDADWLVLQLHHSTVVIVVKLSKSLTTLRLGSSKINQHCWRFHGSGVIAAPQIIGLISLCTGMHHEYFFEVVNVLSCSLLCLKIPKINNWSMDSGIHSVCFRSDFAIKTVVGFLR